MVRRSRFLFKMFFIATVSALCVRLFLLEDYRIASGSMSPGLLQGDLVFIYKGAFNIRLPFSDYEVFKVRRPQRGEVVAFTLPDRGLATFVKRVIGLEGDQIEIRNGVLYVNRVESKYIPEKDDLYTEEFGQGGKASVHWAAAKLKDFGPIDVPKNHFFALGDNRIDSLDSRSWGPVPYSCLKGRVGFVWVSVAGLGPFKNGRAGTFVN